MRSWTVRAWEKAWREEAERSGQLARRIVEAGTLPDVVITVSKRHPKSPWDDLAKRIQFG